MKISKDQLKQMEQARNNINTREDYIHDKSLILVDELVKALNQTMKNEFDGRPETDQILMNAGVKFITDIVFNLILFNENSPSQINSIKDHLINHIERYFKEFIKKTNQSH